jgi:hypothetical protein
MKHASMLSFAMLILASLPACKGDEGREAVRAACSAEIEKLCPGEDRIGQCLRKHESELSDKCKAGLGGRR